MTVLPLALAMMTSLAPAHPHDTLGAAIARRVDADAPLFADDPEKLRTVALYVSVLYRESGLDNAAIGDGGASHCAGQIYLPNGAKTREGWSGTDLREDADKCLAVVSRMLRASIGACSRFPSETRLSVYARGRCDSAEGQRISRDRFWLMRTLVAGARDKATRLFREDVHADLPGFVAPATTDRALRAAVSHAVGSRFCLLVRRCEASS